MRIALLLSMGLLLGAFPVSAGQAAVNPEATARLGARRAAQSSSPYAKLFEAREALKQAVQRRALQPGSKPIIVCGMTVIEADPSFDQKMMVAPPRDANVRYTIRAVDPPVCNSARK